MNKKNKKSFDLITEIIEQPKLEKVLNSTEQEQLETEIYRIAIDNELQEKIIADKNKWIVELLNDIEELREKLKAYKIKKENVAIIMRQYGSTNNIINKFVSKDKIRDKIKELEEYPSNQYIHISYFIQMLNELLEEGDTSAK